MPKKPKLPGKDPAIEESATAVAWIIREIRLCDELAEELFGVTSAQLRLLCVLTEHEGPSINGLGGFLGAHQSSVSALVNALVKKGLVVKTQAPSDGRTVRITITLKGRAVARRVSNVGRPLLSAALAKMSPPQRMRLGNVLAELASLMEAERRAAESE